MMTAPSATPEKTMAGPAVAAPHQIHCAEIWGGISPKEDHLVTPGVRAAIYSSVADGSRGGDIYYLNVCSYGTLTRVALADVRGHGEAVSHLSAWLYDLLEARMNDADGAAVLADLNEIVRTRGFEALTTAVVATFHRDKGVLYYAYAGHPPMLLSRCESNAWQPLEAGPTAGPANLPLGMLRGVPYTQEQVRIEPGDRIALYSDGVAECPGPGGEEYGDARFGAALDHARDLTLPDARRAIREDLQAYAQGPLVHDDCTLLLLEPLPAVPFWKRRLFPVAAGRGKRKG